MTIAKRTLIDVNKFISLGYWGISNIIENEKVKSKIKMVGKNVSTYHRLMQGIALLLPEKVRPMFLHPAGPTTIFFWAPTFKWGLVLANIGDLNRPVDTISLSQSSSLMMTGLIWSRYSVVIIPKNYNLLSVNAFVFLSSGYNFVRGAIYQYSLGKN